MADRDRTDESRNRSRGWLAAVALALGAGAVLALGSGTAHADADGGASSADGARSARAATGSSARDSGHRVRGSSAVTGAVSPRNRLRNDSRQTSWIAAARTPSPCLQSGTCGTATFGFTGAPQSWTVPAGVQSVLVNLQGGFGGQPCSFQSCTLGYTPPLLYPAVVIATLALPPDSASLNILVGGGGTDGGDGGAGGYNGGASGGSGSLAGQGGAGGGGATSVYVNTGSSEPTVVLVAGGGGGFGGYRSGDAGEGGAAGGVGDGSGFSPPGPGGVWIGGDGIGAGGDNGGAGGAGGSQSGGNGSGGGDAETASGNGGGGGGGGGYLGGAGGQSGQASIDPFSQGGSGGGGGGGSSYADPSLTTNAIASLGDGPYQDGTFAPALLNGSAVIRWVDILTTALRPLRVGRSANQLLLAGIGEAPIEALVWQAGAGLPAGLSLGSSGVLSGTPTKAGRYSFPVTVTLYEGQAPLATSVITYTGRVTALPRLFQRRDTTGPLNH